GEQPAPVGQRQQQGGDAEADDDGGQRERLGQGVGERPAVGVADERRPPGVTRADDQGVGPVAQEGDADDDAAELALQHQVGADAEEGGRGGGEHHGHGAVTSAGDERSARSSSSSSMGAMTVRGSSPKDSKTMSTSPSTSR